MPVKLIINFTPTGMIPTQEMTPHVPVSVSEIIEDVDSKYKEQNNIIPVVST